jgi:hypothetical protein
VKLLLECRKSFKLKVDVSASVIRHLLLLLLVLVVAMAHPGLLPVIAHELTQSAQQPAVATESPAAGDDSYSLRTSSKVVISYQTDPSVGRPPAGRLRRFANAAGSRRTRASPCGGAGNGRSQACEPPLVAGLPRRALGVSSPQSFTVNRCSTPAVRTSSTTSRPSSAGKGPGDTCCETPRQAVMHRYTDGLQHDSGGFQTHVRF